MYFEVGFLLYVLGVLAMLSEFVTVAAADPLTAIFVLSLMTALILQRLWMLQNASLQSTVWCACAASGEPRMSRRCLAPLLQIRLGRVACDAHVLHLAAGGFAPPHRQPSPRWPRRADEEDVLMQLVFLQKPLQVIQLLLVHIGRSIAPRHLQDRRPTRW